jgi:hypothetical protein
VRTIGSMVLRMSNEGLFVPPDLASIRFFPLTVPVRRHLGSKGKTPSLETKQRSTTLSLHIEDVTDKTTPVLNQMRRSTQRSSVFGGSQDIYFLVHEQITGSRNCTTH